MNTLGTFGRVSVSLPSFFRPYRAYTFCRTINPGRRSQTRFALGYHLSGFLFRPAEAGQQHRREHRDDSQKFDQAKGMSGGGYATDGASGKRIGEGS